MFFCSTLIKHYNVAFYGLVYLIFGRRVSSLRIKEVDKRCFTIERVIKNHRSFEKCKYFHMPKLTIHIGEIMQTGQERCQQILVYYCIRLKCTLGRRSNRSPIHFSLREFWTCRSARTCIILVNFSGFKEKNQYGKLIL